MSDVAELVVWLRTQVEADRAAALATNSGPWRTTDDQDDFDGDILIGYVTLRAEDGTALADDRSGALAEEDLRHVARHDPQDVAADCDAKLQLVHSHGRPHECIALTGSGERSVVDGQPWELWEPAHTDDHGLCLVLRLLAQGYRHRPGWKTEWAT